MPMLGFQVVGRNGELKAYVPTPENTTSMYQTAYSLDKQCFYRTGHRTCLYPYRLYQPAKRRRTGRVEQTYP